MNLWSLYIGADKAVQISLAVCLNKETQPEYLTQKATWPLFRMADLLYVWLF